jgi:hypothetical protein
MAILLSPRNERGDKRITTVHVGCKTLRHHEKIGLTLSPHISHFCICMYVYVYVHFRVYVYVYAYVCMCMYVYT